MVPLNSHLHLRDPCWTGEAWLLSGYLSSCLLSSVCFLLFTTVVFFNDILLVRKVVFIDMTVTFPASQRTVLFSFVTLCTLFIISSSNRITVYVECILPLEFDISYY